MSASNQSPSLREAANQFLASLPSDDKATQQEVTRFIRWYGAERSLAALSAPEVASYAEQLSLSDIDYARKFEYVRIFLVYVKKRGWTRTNLATHLKARKRGKARASNKQALQEAVPLTDEGFAQLETELTELKGRRSKLLEDMRTAAADKDFSENAPLDAVKEERGHVEGRIRELEEALKASIPISKEENTVKIGVGDCVSLIDLASSESLLYTIVSPREIDPTRGKISSVSPIGKALIGRGPGDTVEVTVPLGKLRYRITGVNR